MNKAYNIVPPRFEDGRHIAMSDGIKRHGFTVHNDPNFAPAKNADYIDDVLLTWNLHGHRELYRDQFEAQGGRVIVFEEGYTRQLWTEKHFAASLHAHNGAGQWFNDDSDMPYREYAARWERMKLEIEPWRTDGDHILVCGQRGIGSRLMASPHKWHEHIATALPQYTKRKIVIRPHPGKDKTKANKSLVDQLKNCWACVIWSSGCGVRALLRGIPVVSLAPHWILQRAAWGSVSGINYSGELDPEIRLLAFKRLAWAQWTIEEIRQGKTFDHLLSLSES